MTTALTLRDLLLRARALHDNASGRRLAEMAQANGHEIDRTQINHILRGSYPHRPKRPLLDAVAYLSGATREEVYEIAGEPLPLGDFREELPEEADVLSVGQRQAVLGVIREFIAAERARAASPEQRGAQKVHDIVSGARGHSR